MNLFHFIFRRVYIRFDYLCLIFETLNIKITTLMLQKTFLARCDNRACLAKTNIMSGSPEAWLSNDLLSKSNTFWFDFRFSLLIGRLIEFLLMSGLKEYYCLPILMMNLSVSWTLKWKKNLAKIIYADWDGSQQDMICKCNLLYSMMSWIGLMTEVN